MAAVAIYRIRYGRIEMPTCQCGFRTEANIALCTSDLLDLLFEARDEESSVGLRHQELRERITTALPQCLPSDAILLQRMDGERILGLYVASEGRERPLHRRGGLVKAPILTACPRSAAMADVCRWYLFPELPSYDALP